MEKTQSFEELFSFYLSYHSDPINQLIHLIFVWPLVFTAQIILSSTTNISAYLTFVPSFIPLNLSLLFSLRFALFYYNAEKPVGVVAAILVLLGLVFSTVVVATYSNAWMIAIGIHVFSWAAQIYGHAAYEVC